MNYSTLPGHPLLVIPDSDVDGLAFEQFGDSLDGRFRIVVREKRLRLYRLCRFRDLFRSHCVRLVAGKECDVDILQRRHFRDVLCVACNVNAKSVNGQHVAVVASFRMKLRSTGRRVIGGDSFNLNAFGNRKTFAVLKRRAGTELLLNSGIDDDLSSALLERGYRGGVKVVEMLMRDDNDVRLRKRRLIRLRFELHDGVNLNLKPVVLDSQAGVLDRGNRYDFAALCCELVRLISAGRETSCCK